MTPPVVRNARRWLWPSAALLLAALVVANLMLGAVSVAPGDVFRILADHLGWGHADVPLRDDAVVWSIRLPRVLLGVTAGAALGVAGTALQGSLRNPLADPYLVGISAGSAVGAAVAVALGVAADSAVVGIVAAEFGFLAGWLAVSVSRFRGRSEIATVILTGVAVSAAAAALVGFVSIIARDRGVPDPSFWLLGGLGRTTWDMVASSLPLFLIGAAAVVPLSRTLDVVLLGSDEAHHLGVDLRVTDRWVLVGASLIGGAAVASAGIVGFVGLAAPHAARSVLGPGHRRLFAAAAILGAVFMSGADLLARVTAEPVEIPLGLVTALVGGPVFLWLLRRTRSTYGSW